MRHSSITFVVGASLLARFVAAQGGGVTVQGVAYDSLRAAPLAGALVTITGVSRATFADSRGRFRFDSVPPGAYRFEMQHAVLDTVGLSGVTRSVRITDGREEVWLAVPSFATLWGAACGARTPPKDSGLVYGTIRDIRPGRRAMNAMIDLTWIDVGVDKTIGLTQRRWRVQARSDENGSYEICGVPTELDLRVQATTDSSSSGLIDLPPRGLRVQRRDLLIGPVDTGTVRGGTIVGSVTDSAGKPFVNARVITDGAPEIRSDSSGRFVVRSVPTGTRQVEVLSIGMSPSLSTVDVTPSDTVYLGLQLRRITILDVVRITASAQQRRTLQGIEDRKRYGFGRFVDSTAIAPMGNLTALFYSMPSVEVRRGQWANQFWILLPATRGRRCLATLFIDGIRQLGFRDDPASTYEMLGSLHPDEIAAVEVYPRAFTTPTEFIAASGEPCGAVVVWTKRFIG